MIFIYKLHSKVTKIVKNLLAIEVFIIMYLQFQHSIYHKTIKFSSDFIK